jgi:hypothetical protein
MVGRADGGGCEGGVSKSGSKATGTPFRKVGVLGSKPAAGLGEERGADNFSSYSSRMSLRSNEVR